MHTQNYKNKCSAISYTSLGQPSPLTAYTENPSSTRAVADHRRAYFRGVAVWKKEVMFSSKAYRKARLTPSSTSDLEILTWIPTSMRQWISSWIFWRRKIRIITVSKTTSNGYIFSPFFLSVYGMFGKKDIVVVATLSRLMAGKLEEPIYKRLIPIVQCTKDLNYDLL